MTSIESVTLEVPDPTAASAFYAAAFGLGPQLGLRASEAPTTGFRGFTLSLVVSQPATVDELIATATAAGAKALKPTKKSFWGYGGVVRAPDGTIWKVATSSKKSTGPATREIDDMVLLMGVADVAASKRFYIDHGLSVAKSFGRKYAEFATTPVKLALYGRRALAKDAGVSPDGTGSHRIVIDSDAGPFTDPDGFAWAAARVQEAPTHGGRCCGVRDPANTLTRILRTIWRFHEPKDRHAEVPQAHHGDKQEAAGIQRRGTSRDEGARPRAKGGRAARRERG